MKYRVIRKSLWDFQPLWYSSRDGHAEGEHVNRGRDTSPRVDISSTWSVCPSVDMLPFGVTVPATVPQRSDIPEGLTNYLVYNKWNCAFVGTVRICKSFTLHGMNNMKVMIMN